MWQFAIPPHMHVLCCHGDSSRFRRAVGNFSLFWQQTLPEEAGNKQTHPKTGTRHHAQIDLTCDMQSYDIALQERHVHLTNTDPSNTFVSSVAATGVVPISVDTVTVHKVT